MPFIVAYAVFIPTVVYFVVTGITLAALAEIGAVVMLGLAALLIGFPLRPPASPAVPATSAAPRPLAGSSIQRD